jgi:hypothetical protein
MSQEMKLFLPVESIQNMALILTSSCSSEEAALSQVITPKTPNQPHLNQVFTYKKLINEVLENSPNDADLVFNL